MSTVAHRGSGYSLWQMLSYGAGSSWQPVLILIGTAVLAIFLQPILQGEVSSGLIFVLGITIVGATSGLIPSLICALAASAVFNFFLADPVLTFRMNTGNDLAPPIIFTLCAFVSGLLSGRLRDKTSQLGKTNLQLESLLDTSRMLQGAPDVHAIQDVLKETVPGRLGFSLWLFTIAEGRACAVEQVANRPELKELADRSLSGDAVIRDGIGVAYRLDGSRSCVGALLIQGPGDAQVDPAFLDALASLVGLAVERAQFASAIAEAEANLRAEGFKSVLLSSVSHDLRTPLTTISASASSLIDYGKRLDDVTSQRLLRGIVDECDRLNRITANLLELSRLQSGGTSLSGQVLSVGDVVRAVVQRARERANGRDIRVSPPGPDVLVMADTALFELALTNVIQNAIQYSEAGTAIHVDARTQDNACVLTVTDQGCGIPTPEQERVFERFYRVKRDHSSPQGSGLGLAIAKGFVEAFDGSIDLTSPVHGTEGTSVTIRLPLFTESAA
ncbi:MAG: ATP-binding protein [Novosphingobium sp.]